ncbi:MAG: protein kinase [Gemmatimonadota bacterium]|nr:protein kinase [Gemmatimonadota bacterium]MDH3479671.1 protein kinase [Gemmatimonadota bacterium]MDH5550364.1 protein kinase [Gemmatimonadota bacterium]
MSEIPSRLSTALADRYRIERELGAGGMATVYLAHDLKHDRKVAIKVLRPELAAVLGAERFVQEIKTTAHLQHPHILPLFDSGEADSFLYYVMPYIEGETLRDKLNRETQLGIEEAVKITTEVADALDYAHRQSVIHRDIKPENILLHDGRPMVADFGIALAVSAAAGGRMTETGLSLGTPHYMSPEQATAEKQITHRSDIYSLGAVLYEMLTGDPPHTGSSAQAIILKIVSEEPPPVTRTRKAVPANVAAAVAQALEKLPADRFESGKGFAAALADPRYEAARAGPARNGASFRWADWRLGALAVAALVVGAVSARWFGGETSTVLPSIRFRDRPPQSQQVVGRQGFSPSISPDGSQFAYNGRTRGAERQYLRRLDQLEARPIPGSDDATRSFFSTDGGWLGFVTRGKLMKVALPGGSPLPIADVQDVVYGADWGSDNFIVFSEGGRLMRVSADGGTPELVAVPDTTAGVTELRWPHVLAGSRDVLVTAWYGALETAQLAVASVASGTVKLLALPGLSPHYAATGHLVYARSDGQIVAVPFDLGKLEPVGQPTQLIGRVEIGFPGLPQFTLSESGSVVYSPAFDRSNGLVLVNRSGAAEQLANADGRAFQDPRFSPSGDRVSVGIDEQIWLYDMDRGTLSRRTSGGSNLYATWLPDGRSLSFSSERGGHRRLFTMAADGSDDPSLLYSGAHRVWESEWSPDGQWVAFREGAIGELLTMRDILVFRPDSESSPPTPLLQTEFDESMLAISPDGKWLAYVSDQTGQREVYVRPFPEGAGWVQVSTDGGVEPSWAPGGGELFYRTPTAMAVARVEVGQAFRVIERELLFDDSYIRRDNFANYDIDPRSGRLLMVRGDPEPNELVIIVNWLEELKAKVPR